MTGRRSWRPARLHLCLSLVLLAATAAGCEQLFGPEARQAAPPPLPAPRPLEPAAAGWVAHLGEADLQLWNDPVFRRQFTKSYLAETPVEPKVAPEERETMQQVISFMGSDKIDAAVDLLQKQNNGSASAVFDYTLGNLYCQKEQPDKAVAAYQIAVTKHPSYLRAWRNMAMIHVRQHDFAKALPILTKIVTLGGGDASIYGIMGFGYLSLDNSLAAESAYRQAILLDPGTMDWKRGLASCLFRQARYADAAALCGQLIAEQANRGELWLIQANAFIGLAQPLRAAENYELVDHLGQATADNLYMLGDLYINANVLELAAGAYMRALDKNPDGKCDRAITAAKVLAARGLVVETKQLIEHVEKVKGKQLDVAQRKDLLKLRARLALAEGSGDEEARVLEEIVSVDPLDGEALIQLGQHCNRVGQPEKAILYYERAESIEKYEADAKVRHAQLLVGQAKYADALPLLRRAQQVKPRDSVQQYLEQIERFAKAH